MSLALWTVLLIFLPTAAMAFDLGYRAANQIVLDCVYGVETVRREHLQLTHTAYGELVSNGDMLSTGWATLHFLINGAISFASFATAFYLFVLLLPRGYRRITLSFSKEASALREKGLPIPVLLMLIPTVILFLLIPITSKPLACALVAVGAVASAWIVTGLMWIWEVTVRWVHKSNRNGLDHSATN